MYVSAPGKLFEVRLQSLDPNLRRRPGRSPLRDGDSTPDEPNPGDTQNETAEPQNEQEADALGYVPQILPPVEMPSVPVESSAPPASVTSPQSLYDLLDQIIGQP